MYRPPSPAEFHRYPATAGTVLLAIAVSIWWWTGHEIEVLTMSYRVWERAEVWRLVASALPHVDLLHLLFNAYWVWVFGSVLEREWGSTATAGVFVLLGAGSASAEHAMFTGGVGLSGVGYGLFGFMWLAGHRQWRFREVIDPTVVKLFLGWFVLCIVLTAMNVWPVANVAHGMGAVLGLLLAAATTSRDRRATAAWGAALVTVTIGCALASSVGRPMVNVGKDGGHDLARDGWMAFDDGRPADAATLFERALRISEDKADWWYNLGVARHRLGQLDGARAAYRRAVELDGTNQQFRDALAGVDDAAPADPP